MSRPDVPGLVFSFSFTEPEPEPVEPEELGVAAADDDDEPLVEEVDAFVVVGAAVPREVPFVEVPFLGGEPAAAAVVSAARYLAADLPWLPPLEPPLDPVVPITPSSSRRASVEWSRG